MHGSQKIHYPSLKCHENEDKIGNDYVLRNDYRIKFLVSFFSEDYVICDEIKICHISEYQSNKNRAFRRWGTPSIGIPHLYTVSFILL